MPCAGWAPRSTHPIRRCRTARSRSPSSFRRHRSCRAAWPRSAWSSEPRAPASQTAAGAAEAAAREHWRSAQREADNARELHAMAEREMARNTARISALTEAKTRLSTGRDEAQAGRGVAESALAELPPSADLE